MVMMILAEPYVDGRLLAGWLVTWLEDGQIGSVRKFCDNAQSIYCCGINVRYHADLLDIISSIFSCKTHIIAVLNEIQ